MVEYRVVSSLTEREAAYDLRKRVFVLEQDVPEEMELDEFDQDAIHAIATENNQVVGTGRLVLEENHGRIGRMAVEKEKRGLGIGKGIIETLEVEARKQNLHEIYLHAQTHAFKFYVRLGYHPRGEIFEEAGIEHVEMFKSI